jgi:protein-disulfide isomerase
MSTIFKTTGNGMRTGSTTQLILPVSSRDHIKGPRNAPVTLVEYGDDECPYCGQVYWYLKEVEETLGDLLCFVFRNFPLASVHPHAEHGAEAAEAAGAQGKFWQMHDVLFERQRALEDQHLVAYAAEIGLDVPRFIQEMTEHRYADRVREDFLSGVRSGVNGTPTFFINGERYHGSFDSRSLLAALRGVAEEKSIH